MKTLIESCSKCVFLRDIYFEDHMSIELSYCDNPGRTKPIVFSSDPTDRMYLYTIRDKNCPLNKGIMEFK